MRKKWTYRNRRIFILGLTIFLCLFFRSVEGQTQVVPPKTFAVGGDLALFTTLGAGDRTAAIYFSPSLEYYVVQNGALAMKFVLDFSNITENSLVKIVTKRIFQPYLRYHFLNGCTFLAGTQYDLEFKYQPNLHWGAGYSFFVMPRVCITPLMEFNHNFYKFAARPVRMNFSFGAAYYFNRKV